METREIEIVISSELLKKAAASDETKGWETTANSVAHAVSYDRSLKDIDASTIRRAIQAAPSGADFTVLMKSIRDTHAEVIREKEERQKAEAKIHQEENAEVIGWGFLLRCWDAYQATGDLSRVRMLTVTFLSDWLQTQEKLLLDDEKQWCRDISEKDASDALPENKDSIRKNSYEEAVALVLMKKLDRSLKASTEGLQQLLDEKRRQYADYYRQTYGREPDWSLLDINRTPATSAFRKRVH